MVELNPILLDFPSEFKTKRLVIRAPRYGDGKVVQESIHASFPELKPWMPFAQEIPTVDESEENIRRSIAQFILREDLRFLLFESSTNAFIGSSGLHRINWDAHSFEIGYWIDTRFSGNGLMTEAVTGIIEFARKHLGAKRIEIKCDPTNHKSKSIPIKLGFTLEGQLKQNKLTADGKELRDTCIYAKTFRS
ncbi:GNAT family N-acetyltransferase [Bacillus weihaiensis]|uniref:GNAT family N-acetyltransferase n=1 Tax=Bacillus weihaiensis TaxID=1547283 RepID=UPI0018F223D9|nr:GNAT family N-acetyltransferase [Bacillus weihaiensis]